MGDPEAPTGEGDNTEYRIRRTPDLAVVSTGARIRYVCEWKGPGAQPTVAGEHSWGPRDGIRWYAYSNQAPSGFFERRVKAGPLQPSWDRSWEEAPGQYTVIAEIRSSLDGPKRPPSYRYLGQQVGHVGAMLKDWLDRLLKKGEGPSPDEAESEIRRFRGLLSEIAARFSPPNPKQHAETVKKWADLAGRLRGLLSSTDKKRRIAVRGMHLEKVTQAQRPLFLFLADLGEVVRAAGRSGMVRMQRWVLVDWTDPSDPRFRGSYEGEGTSTAAAITACLSSWDWENRYPEGHVLFEIPTELRALLGEPVRRQMDTNGKNLTDEVIVVFQWIAIGGMLVAGFCYIFVAIPALTSGAAAASMIASTAGAVFSVSQRWRDGIFDWQADAMDGLTIVSNLLGAGVWARGARVRLLGDGGKQLDFVFLGTRVAADTVQGVLIAASHGDELEKLLKDPNYSPEERARKMLAVFAELTALGLMTAISFRASAKEADALCQKPKYLQAHPDANVAEETLDRLTKPGELIDRTKPPIAEGHSAEPQHKTTVNTGIRPAPKLVGPEDTAFAKAYPPDPSKYSHRELTKYKIQILDRDGFGLMAEVNPDTLDLTIVIETTKGSKRDGTFQGSKYFWAKDLYPKMYQHFAQQGVTVKSVSGTLMWDNVKDTSIPLYDRLLSDAHTKKLTGDAFENAKRDAAVKAVQVAKTYHYHVEAGIPQVTHAERDGNGFDFKLER